MKLLLPDAACLASLEYVPEVTNSATVYYNTKELALALVGVAVEHLHGKQVVGRGADVGVKNNKGNTGVLLAVGRIRDRIVIVATSRKYEAHADGG